MKKNVILIFLFILISNLLLGQTVIKNKLDPNKILDSKDVVLKKELVISSQIENKPLFQSIITFRVDEQGNIYALDQKARKLMKFDRNGNLKFSIGHKGQGPGEFDVLSGIEFGKNDTIMVQESRNKKALYFSLNGEFIREISTATYPFLIRIDDDSLGNFYGTLMNIKPEKIFILFKKFDSKFNEIDEFQKVERRRNPNEIRLYPPRIFFRILNNDNVLWANCKEYSLHIIDKNGNLKKLITKKNKPVKITKQDQEQILNERYGARELPPNITFVFPTHYPPIHHLLVDNHDNIFVMTYEKSEDGSVYYDLFNFEGKFLAKFPLNFTIHYIHNDKLFSLEEDEEGFQRIVRYKYKIIYR